MTIAYPNGTVLNAVVLSHEEHEIRAIVAGCDDVLVFSRIYGTWISEDGEAVTIQFEWQRRRARPAEPSEDDCVCPKELAALLFPTLLDTCNQDGATADTLYVLGPDGNCFAVNLSQVKPS